MPMYLYPCICLDLSIPVYLYISVEISDIEDKACGLETQHRMLGSGKGGMPATKTKILDLRPLSVNREPWAYALIGETDIKIRSIYLYRSICTYPYRSRRMYIYPYLSIPIYTHLYLSTHIYTYLNLTIPTDLCIATLVFTHV